MTTFLAAQILLTIVTLGFSLVPVLADFNATHATNPRWTGHARFHVVWQVSSYIALACVTLVILWIPGEAHELRVYLAASIALCVFLGFFAAVATRRLYRGELADENGHQPIRTSWLGRDIAVDLNTAAFTLIVLILVGAWALLIAN